MIRICRPDELVLAMRVCRATAQQSRTDTVHAKKQSSGAPFGSRSRPGGKNLLEAVYFCASTSHEDRYNSGPLARKPVHELPLRSSTVRAPITGDTFPDAFGHRSDDQNAISRGNEVAASLAVKIPACRCRKASSGRNAWAIASSPQRGLRGSRAPCKRRRYCLRHAGRSE